MKKLKLKKYSRPIVIDKTKEISKKIPVVFRSVAEVDKKVGNISLDLARSRESFGTIQKDLEAKIISFQRLAEDFDRGAKLQAENVRSELDAKIQKATQDLANSLKQTSLVIEGVDKNNKEWAKGYSTDKSVLAARTDKVEKTIEQVILDLKRLFFLIDQISQPQGTTRIQMYLNGVDLGALYNAINLIAGTGISITSVANTITRQMDTTISSTGGGGFSTLLPIETPNGSLTVFTFSTATAQPTFIISDGIMMQATSKAGTVNWTWDNATHKATMSVPPQDDIIAIK